MAYPQILQQYRVDVDEGLKKYLVSLDCPSRLKESMAYSLMVGGKRIKSALLLAAYSMFEPRGLDPLPTACAIEMIHTYSLIHDDLPAMDDDDMRRGQPSNHKKFGEATAILAGDALLTEAFAFMAGHLPSDHTVQGVKALHEVAVAAGAVGMVGGQVLDTLETGHRVGLDELKTIHAMKTGALFRAALRCGGILAYAEDQAMTALTRYAEAVGLAFQVVDDILDVVGDAATLGKTIGKDEAQDKNTYVSLLGLEPSRDFARALLDESLSALQGMDDRAEPLRGLARFVVERSL